VDDLRGKPVAGSGTCVDIIKEYVPGLKGLPTTSWKAGVNVIEAGGKVAKGTAIATFVNGRYPRISTGNHAAIVVSVMASGIWVMDQWASDSTRTTIKRRLIRIPPPRQQKNADGTFRDPSNNALAFYVIEK
jgi:hypothetical protein